MRAFPQAKMMPPTPGNLIFVMRDRLSKIAAPDASVQCTADLGVVVRGEDLSVTGLALVGPALGLGGADTVKAGERRHLAEPATDEDVLEVVSVTGGKNLTVRAGVELVDHLSVGGDNGVHSVGLELSVVGKRLHTHLRAPCVDNGLVAGGRRSGSRGGGGGRGLGAGGSRSLRVLLVDDGAGGSSGNRGGRVLLVDNGGHSRSLVDGSRGLGGLSRLGRALGVVDSVNDSLVNDVNVLDLLVLGPGDFVVGGCESRAGKGEDGSGVTHFGSGCC